MQINYINAFSRLAYECDLDPFTIKYCIRRIRCEGIKFLTVTLPQLSRSVLRSLELGYFERPTSFAWKRKSLRYFTKFLNKIFDPSSGRVLPDVDPLAIKLLRQVCDYFYKLALPYDEEKILEFEEKFVSTDSSVPLSGEYDERWVDKLRKDFETYYPELSSATVDDILHNAPAVRSGPGTFSQVADYQTESGLPWYVRKTYDLTVPEFFRSWSWASRPLPSAPVPGVTCDSMYSEVLFVPKDSRGPRVIVREPYSLLRYHLSYNKYIGRQLEYATRFRINFQNQQENRALAQQSSIDQKWCTIDLRDASDSVSSAIVRHLFRNSPGLLRFVLSRCQYTRLPSTGQFYKMKKLSGMGSGLTFPTMSLLIHLTISRAFSDYYKIPYRRAQSLVYVYGDDIIVPTRMFNHAVQALNRVGLSVNTDKCFHRSHFRESCGGDFYKGSEVAPVRLKLQGCSLKDSKDILIIKGQLAFLELERHCRELVKEGLNRLSDYYYDILEKSLGKLPLVTGESPILGRYTILPLEYGTDSSGTYESIKAIMPVPKSLTVGETMCPYVFLRQSLTRSQVEPLDLLYGLRRGSTYGEASIPRSVSYKRMRVSAYRLMG